MRFWFGDQLADVVIAPGEQVNVGTHLGYEALLVPGARLWLWDPTTGDRVTDLLDAVGTPITELVSDAYGRIPRFRGPDEIRRLLIGQATDTLPPDEDQESVQQVIVSTDWPADVDRVASRVTALEELGGGDPGGGEYVAAAHPMIWAMAGDLATRRSPNTYVNMEGRGQTITAVRASAATITAGTVTVRVLTVDVDTGVGTVVASADLSAAARTVVVRPDASVSDGTGVTVEVELGAEAAGSDVTVQVMIR